MGILPQQSELEVVVISGPLSSITELQSTHFITRLDLDGWVQLFSFESVLPTHHGTTYLVPRFALSLGIGTKGTLR